MKTLRPKLTFANVVSCLALFVALGGSAYAATQLKKNSVTTKSVKNGAITLPKINASAQAALKGQQGPPGTNGTDGKEGASGATNLTVVSKEGTGFAEAECPSGTTPTGGGGGYDLSGGALEVSAPLTSGSNLNGSWLVDSVVGADKVLARIVCASP